MARPTADEVLAGLDVAGRVALVTGGTAGIGFETARALAAAGVRVHVGARSAVKADVAIASIRDAHPAADLVPFVADLGSLASIRAGVDGFEDDALHALIANAGVFGPRYVETADGIERTVGVCHVGHVALVDGLLPKLQAGAPSRVVMVSSHSHKGPRALDLADVPMTADTYRGMGAYDVAKLCNVLYANELDRRVRDRGIRANSLHPGTMVTTSITRDSRLASLGMKLMRPFSPTIPQAAATSVWAAFSPELEGVGGAYLDAVAIARASAAGRDEDAAARLWEHTEALLQQLGWGA